MDSAGVGVFEITSEFAGSACWQPVLPKTSDPKLGPLTR